MKAVRVVMMLALLKKGMFWLGMMALAMSSYAVAQAQTPQSSQTVAKTTAPATKSNDKKVAKPLPYMAKTPWSVLVYYGWMTTKLENQVIRFQLNRGQARLGSVEVAYQLAPENPMSQFFAHIGATTSLAMGVTYQNDPQGRIWEFNPHFMWRWGNFPWSHVIDTSFGFGEGVSYATSVPWRERRSADDAANAKRFMSMMVIELTVALPQYPNLQLVYRIHHRSGVFGLFQASNSGSTAYGFGLRYYF